MDQHELDDAPRVPAHVGVKLKAAREAAGYTLADIAERTRIPTRHLNSIETGQLGELPGATYAIGFVRTYARQLDLDEASIVEQARHEMGWQGQRSQARSPDYVPTDPRRLPPALFVWTAGILLVLLVGGYLLFRSGAGQSVDEVAMADAGGPAVGSIGGAPQAGAPQSGVAGPAAMPPAPARGGEVVLTATAPVWLRIYDASRTRLFEKEMAAGERYVVPPDADGPMILTGKPDAISVTVAGQPVAPLGTGERTIADVGISAAALAARTAALPPPSSVRTMAPAAN